MTNEALYYDALREISRFENLEWLRRNSEKKYGLSYEEALEMAYENMRECARYVLHGKRRPRKEPTNDTA